MFYKIIDVILEEYEKNKKLLITEFKKYPFAKQIAHINEMASEKIENFIYYLSMPKSTLLNRDFEFVRNEIQIHRDEIEKIELRYWEALDNKTIVRIINDINSRESGVGLNDISPDYWLSEEIKQTEVNRKSVVSILGKLSEAKRKEIEAMREW